MYIPGRRRTGSSPSRTSICLAVYPASPLDPLAAGFVRALLPRPRADDLPAGGRSKRSGCGTFVLLRFSWLLNCLVSFSQGTDTERGAIWEQFGTNLAQSRISPQHTLVNVGLNCRYSSAAADIAPITFAALVSAFLVLLA